MDYNVAAINTLVQLLPNIFLFLLPFHKSLRFPKWVVMLLYMGFILICSLFLAVSPSFKIGNLDWRMVYTGIFIVFAIFLCFSVIKEPPYLFLFTMFLVTNYNDILTLFAKMMKFKPVMTADYNASILRLSLRLAVLMVLTFPLMYLFMTRLFRPAMEQTRNVYFWKYLWLIPFAFYTVYRLCLHPEYSDKSALSDPKTFIIPFAWAMVSFLTYGIILKALLESAKNNHLQNQLRLAEVQTSLQKQNYDLLTKNIQKTRQYRHDLRQHLLVLKGLADHQDIDGIQNYLDKYIQTLDTGHIAPVCKNYAVDSLVRYYMGCAYNHQIEINVSLNVPENLYILESDLCIIIGNLLENALESCRQQKNSKGFIRFKMDIAGEKMLVISVINSYEGTIMKKGEHFISSKHHGEGIGTFSVRNIAEKYHGICKFNYDNHLFEASVLLNMESVY